MMWMFFKNNLLSKLSLLVNSELRAEFYWKSTKGN